MPFLSLVKKKTRSIQKKTRRMKMWASFSKRTPWCALMGLSARSYDGAFGSGGSQQDAIGVAEKGLTVCTREVAWPAP